MPRLNHGTLLENLVVLEVARLLGATASSLELACSFTMPPLTQYWHKSVDEQRNNPRFNREVVEDLLTRDLFSEPASSFAALLYRCLQNGPRLPVVPYAVAQAAVAIPLGGPNGALLVALLRAQAGCTTRIWSNDLVGSDSRYRSAAHDVATECPRTSAYAWALLERPTGAPADAFHGGPFPGSIQALAGWRHPCDVRLGFLDPDSNVTTGAAEPGKVDRAGHARWLTNLHVNATATAGVMFFANQNAPTRPAQIAAFHEDALGDFPTSVVFRHGNYMVGVKLHCPDAAVTRDTLVQRVAEAWSTWSRLVGRAPDGLSAYLDGQGEAA